MPRVTARAPLRTRRVPQRTCVACGAVIAKRELVRIVRGPDGAVRPDPTGKKAGRGAYLHAQRRCWELALKRKKLERSLKVTLSPQDAEAISCFAESLPAEEVVQ